ncbi:MAG: TonB-dependent receptor domain-containing protein [Flavisolibacter sp.]
MKKYFFLGVLLFSLVSVFAQDNANNVITGKVMDSVTRTPLEYATVTVFPTSGHKPITGATTDQNGVFHLGEVRDSVVNMVFEFIGYEAFSLKDIHLKGRNGALQLPTVFLARNTAVMQDVIIQAHGKVIENKIDKMVFNAERDVTSQSGVATDILKKVPQVSVDVDGNVQLAGNGGVRFLINGKPSSAFGSSITDVLQSIPASQIKSIEVITNPGAKYDAAGMGGIINIILKSSNARGYNGNLSLTGGSLQQNGSFNFNLRKGNLGMNAFVSGNTRFKSNAPYFSDRITTDGAGQQTSLLHQEGNNDFTRHGYQTGMGFDWTLKKKNDFSGSISYNNFGYKGNAHSTQDQQFYSGNTPEQMVSLFNNTSQFSFRNVDAGLHYKRTFNKEDQELEINVNSSWGRDHYAGLTGQYLLPQDSLYYGSNSDNPGKVRETEMKADYSQPLAKNVNLGLGGKAGFYDISSQAQVLGYQPAMKTYFSNASLSNDLDYHQKVYAVYSEISFPLGKILDAKLGGRYERTEIQSYYSNAASQVKVPGYNTFVPSVYLSRKITDNQTLKLSYSKRIERPDYHDLNPFINTNDPKNLTAGNPYLQPEIGHRFELGYQKEAENIGSFMVSLFYRINDHDIQPYVIYYPSYLVGDSTYTNVSVSTRQNIGKEQNAGLSLFGDLRFSSKFSLRSNAFVFHRHTINELDPVLDYNSFNYRFNLNATYQFTPTLIGEFFGNFNSARHEAQGSYPSFTTYNLAFRKQFWNKKGSLAFTAVNPFSEYVNQTTHLTGTNFTVNNTRRIPFRSFGLNFTWKFGQLEFKQKKEEKDNGNLNAPVE